MYLTVLTTDQVDAASLGRLDHAAMSDQTLMELVVGELPKDYRFLDCSGNFSDITAWKGLKFKDDGSLSEIEWVLEKGLFCAAPVRLLNEGHVVHLEWLPSSVRMLRIVELNVVGTISTEQLSASLSWINLRRNKFHGTFALEGLPRGMYLINIRDNEFSGTLDLRKMPERMGTFDATRNRFSGALDCSSLPKGLRLLLLAQNAFTGPITFGPLPQEIEQMDFSTNQAKQEVLVLPEIPHSVHTLELDRYNIGKVIDHDGKEWIGL